MKTKLAKTELALIASMLFGLFFGAGNLIFPIRMGQLAGANMWVAFIGLLITGVGLPLLGVASIGISRSDGLIELSGKVGRGYSVFFTCALYLTIGPFFAIPRCGAVSFTIGMQSMLGEGAYTKGVLVVFSLLFFLAVLVLSLNPGEILTWVGKVLTPLLLLGLAAIIVKGIVTPLGTIAPEAQIDSAVVTGVKAGYQTMDALAALPFGILVLQSVVDKGYTESGKKFRIMSGSSILACVLLLAVYMGLAYLGATVSAQYDRSIGRAQLVMAIVEALMGKTGMIIFGIVVGLACITTAVALTSSAAAYFAKLCRGKVPYKVFVIVICVFSAVVSNLGLDRIVAIAAPVLDIVYPPTLVLVFISLVVPRLPDRISRGAVIGALLMSVLCTLDGYGVPLTFLHKLPLFELGFAWVLPSVLFGAGAAMLPHRKEKAGKAEPACAGGEQG